MARPISSEVLRPQDAERLTIRCSLLDHPLRNLQVPVAFFYDRKLDEGALAQALLKILRDFAPFNARLRAERGDLLIECGTAGVSFSLVRRDCTLAAALASLHDGEQRKLVDVLDVRRNLARGEPVLTVRVSHFSDDKTCVGVCWNHAVGDMHSFMLLMKAWSRTMAGQPYDTPLVVENRDAYLEKAIEMPGRARTGLRLLTLTDMGPLVLCILRESRGVRPIVFQFTPDEIEDMRHDLEREGGERLSANDALCAHMFSFIAECDPRPNTRELTIVVNTRRRAGLPDALLGNMITNLTILCEPGKDAAEIARDLRHGIVRFMDEHFDYHANIRFIREHGCAHRVGLVVPNGLDPVRGSLSVTNWSKLGVYDVAFGGGPPLFFSAVTEEVPFPGFAGVAEGPGNSGLTFAAFLPRKVAQRLTAVDMKARVHRYRGSIEGVPDLVRGIPWLH